MKTTNLVFRNTYRDSVSLMRLAIELEAVDGIDQAAAMMGTRNNKTLLEQADILTKEGKSASNNDLIVALHLSDLEREAELLRLAEELLVSGKDDGRDWGEYLPKGLDGALNILPDANLAVISVPGEYAAYEATKALDRGLHVLLFSNNVSVEDEVELKKRAIQNGLFLLGPDCGTAIINNVPLGFANVTQGGRVGLVSASGTGLQQVVCLLSSEGEGVSQALGVGGRDLDDRVGGMMMFQGLRALENDESVEVIVLISKPPGPETMNRLLHTLEESPKPCVVCFLGVEQNILTEGNLFIESTLENTVLRVLSILRGDPLKSRFDFSARHKDYLRGIDVLLDPTQQYIRGLYSGGTLCYEALLVLKELVDSPVSSNLELEGVVTLKDQEKSRGHTLLDLGDDRLTIGRPHPMIDLHLRCRRLIQEAEDPEVAVLLLDVVLGHGSHSDPASELVPALQQAKNVAAAADRGLACVVVLCGTKGDPQSLERQRSALTEVGAIVVDSNAHAARIAAEVGRNKSRIT